MIERVAYVFPFDVSQMPGMSERLHERVSTWSELGVETHLIACVAQSREDVDFYASIPCDVTLLRARHSQLATMRVPKAVSESKADVTYMRYGLPTPGLVMAARANPTVLEIHSDDLAEARYRSWAFRALLRAFRGPLLSSASGLVFVDPDLKGGPGGRSFAGLQAPRISIPNGVKLQMHVDYGGTRPRNPGPPRLVMAVGAAEPWQGVDKVIELAQLCPTLEFVVVGDLASLPNAPPNVTLAGPKRGREFTDALESADCGVGNLALERVGRRRPSPLKVRDYIRTGLPCVLAHDDPDLEFEDPTVLNLGYGFAPSAEVAKRVTEFAEATCGRSISERVALAVSMTEKEHRRLTFLSSVSSAESQ